MTGVYVIDWKVRKLQEGHARDLHTLGELESAQADVLMAEVTNMGGESDV